ncbi:alpha/beta hydrolase [Streptomyces sp. LP05-1]|uniref:Alpha/beta hydrolase n=1 Tax=Streptomyces pyxinae TaxID=2970734 RepID=A0ABT2CBQ6_9ACTN|nr:alpha/beta hydrolase [Streptomyces sp. LP05-1]MCS0634843.1 alpha/beta hydrolase [Streptomyces sp. LP05-1]
MTPRSETRAPGRPTLTLEEQLIFRGYRFVVRTASADASATETVVILGGSSQDRFSWLRYERPLLPYADVLTVELPGYGDADPLPVEYGMDFLSDAVAHAVDTLELGRVNLFGTCFGAAVALRLTQRRPELVARLLLGATATGISPEYVVAATRWRRLVDERALEELARDMVGEFMAPAEHGTVRRRTAVARLMRQRFAALTERQLAMDIAHHERLLSHPWSLPEPGVDVPLLVFTGEYDTLTPPVEGRRVAERLGGRFTTVRESDHLVPVERDTDTADLMARFFTDRPLDGLPYLNPVERFGRS